MNKNPKNLEILVIEDIMTGQYITKEERKDIYFAFSNMKYNDISYSVTFAESVEEGLKLINEKKFDIYISDMGLPMGKTEEIVNELEDEKKQIYKDRLGIDPSQYNTSESLDTILNSPNKNEKINELGEENLKLLMLPYVQNESEYKSVSNGVILIKHLEKIGKEKGKDYFVFTNKDHSKIGLSSCIMEELVNSDEFKNMNAVPISQFGIPFAFENDYNFENNPKQNLLVKIYSDKLDNPSYFTQPILYRSDNQVVFVGNKMDVRVWQNVFKSVIQTYLEKK